ncbi:MAG TPA: hypothetical protein VFJ06_00290 [Halococcus sp.]|nr:hypothetical protein [Halococcus sp.]
MSTDEQTTLSVADESDNADTETPSGACVNYEECGNVVPENGKMCGPCLDAARARDREQREEI